MNFQKINKLFLVFMLCNFFLIFARMVYTGSPFFAFLYWNLFLAYLPLALSIGLYKNGTGYIVETIGTLLIWLLFLPNAPYIITDFLHLGNGKSNIMWLDITILFSSAFNGLMMGVTSIFIIEKYLLKIYSINIVKAIIFISIAASGFGVYMGRYMRWNSWSIATHPINLFLECTEHFNHPYQHPRTWAISILFAGILWASLFFIKTFSNLIDSEKTLEK